MVYLINTLIGLGCWLAFGVLCTILLTFYLAAKFSEWTLKNIFYSVILGPIPLVTAIILKNGWFRGRFGVIRILKCIGGILLMSTPLLFLIFAFTHSLYALLPMMVSGWCAYGGWNWLMYGDLTGAIQDSD